MTDLVVETGLTPDQSEMVSANLGLIGYLIAREAKHLVCDTYDTSDAFQDGVFGLARAVQKFDPTRGYRFSTYAMPHIFQAMQRGKGRADGINFRRAYAVNRPDDYQPPLSLDHPIPTEMGDNMDLIDLLPAPSDTEAEVATDLVSSALAEGLRSVCVDQVERDLVEALVAHCDTGGPVRYASIGARYGRSGEWMRRRLRLVIERYRDTAS